MNDFIISIYGDEKERNAKKNLELHDTYELMDLFVCPQTHLLSASEESVFTYCNRIYIHIYFFLYFDVWYGFSFNNP